MRPALRAKAPSAGEVFPFATAFVEGTSGLGEDFVFNYVTIGVKVFLVLNLI